MYIKEKRIIVKTKNKIRKQVMKMSNYIFILIGLSFIVLGLVLEHNRYIFDDSETAGYTGFFLYLFGIFIFSFQFVIWGIRILIAIFKELWNEYKSRK